MGQKRRGKTNIKRSMRKPQTTRRRTHHHPRHNIDDMIRSIHFLQVLCLHVQLVVFISSIRHCNAFHGCPTQIGIIPSRQRSYLYRYPTLSSLYRAYASPIDKEQNTQTRTLSTVRSDHILSRYGWGNHLHQKQQLQYSIGFSTKLHMGKANVNKKKSKKKSIGTTRKASTTAAPTTTTTAATAATTPSPAAPRVTANSLVPVRQQIAWAQWNKQYRAMQQKTETGTKTTTGTTTGIDRSLPQQKKTVRTKYRRTWDPDEIEQKAEERRRRGQDPDWNVILNRRGSLPLMIVDGYNIIHHWTRLKKHMIRGDLAHARQLLIDDLENLASLKHWRIECVFDGTRRRLGSPLGHPTASLSASTKALLQTTRHEVSKHGVRIVFTGTGIEADSYIESRCAAAKMITDGVLTGSLIVATDDAMIRLAGHNAGAVCMSAERFVMELKAVKEAVDYRVEVAVAKINGHSIRPAKLRGPNSVMQGCNFKNKAVVIQKNRKNRHEEFPEDKNLQS